MPGIGTVLGLSPRISDEVGYGCLAIGTRAKLDVSSVLDATRIEGRHELAPGVVHLWHRQLTAPLAEVNACYGLLSQEEKERAMRFRIDRPRTDFVLTRGTLRLLLAHYLNTSPQHVCFRYAAQGKPALVGESELYFNASHTEGLALMAFAHRRAIGVDVENLERKIEVGRLAERFFSEREKQALKQLRGDELQAAFFRCWTRKEAYIKAKGDGLSLPLDQFDVSITADDRDALLATRPDPAEATRWTIRDVAVGAGYAAAVAVAES
jgi:4'-phosphopantetheinyl transferase